MSGKTFVVLLSLSALAASVQSQSLRRRRRGSAAPSPSAPPTVIRMRQVQVPAPRMQRPPPAPTGVRPAARPAAQGVNGPARPSALTTIQPSMPPPARTTIIQNPNFVNNVQNIIILDNRPNFFFWHVFLGVSFCHYYDDFGAHWYGFYAGPDFYWTRYYGGYWWWYDPVYARWDFFDNGYWWWAGPGGAMYVYVNNGYYPYDAAGVTVKQPQVETPPGSPPPPAPSAEKAKGSTSLSPDGRRMVQIAGEGSEAFLYDRTPDGRASFRKFLARNAERARWTGGKAGRKPELLLDFKDGSFAIYDEDGVPLEKSQTP